MMTKGTRNWTRVENPVNLTKGIYFITTLKKKSENFWRFYENLQTDCLAEIKWKGMTHIFPLGVSL
jgi:hypothetical protein